MKKQGEGGPRRARGAARRAPRALPGDQGEGGAASRRSRRSSRSILAAIPNVPHESVPVGAGERTTRSSATWGEKPDLPLHAQAALRARREAGHAGLRARGQGRRAAASRSSRAALARLERALVDLHDRRAHRSKGYPEMLPPYLVNCASR